MLQRSKSPQRPRRTGGQAKVEQHGVDAAETSPPDVIAEAVAEVLADAAEAPVQVAATASLAITVPAAAPEPEPETAATATTEIAEAAGTVAATLEESTPAEAASATTPGTESTHRPARGALTFMENPMQQANKAAETMMKAAEEAAEFGRGNVEALTKATQIYVAGVQDLGRQTFAIMQGLTDHALEGAKALSSVKSLHEAAQIQSNYARAAVEKSVAESAKLGEAALKLTEEAMAPLTARVTLASEKVFRPSLAA